jgi:hypothetical protein
MVIHNFNDAMQKIGRQVHGVHCWRRFVFGRQKAQAIHEAMKQRDAGVQ